jgi:hypothetical protein
MLEISAVTTIIVRTRPRPLETFRADLSLGLRRKNLQVVDGVGQVCTIVDFRFGLIAQSRCIRLRRGKALRAEETSACVAPITCPYRLTISEIYEISCLFSLAFSSFRFSTTPYPAPKIVPNTVNGSGTAVEIAGVTLILSN